MTIGEAAAKYETDVAEIWEWISTGRKLVDPADERRIVVLRADERIGTLWVVTEVEA